MKPAAETESSSSAVLAIQPQGGFPQLVQTMKFNARAKHQTELRPGSTHKLLVNFEKDGKKFWPSNDDLIIPELTTGLMNHNLVFQGIRKEEDRDGQTFWFIYLLSAPTSRL